MAKQSLRVTTLFFDKLAVTSKVDKARIKILSKFGAFVRRRARSSIRKRKKASQPGEPPTDRVGLVKKFLFFSYDKSSDSVVVGPERLNKPTTADGKTVVEALEHSGQVYVTEVQYKDGTWHRRIGGRADLRGRPERIRKADLRARPFMGPAFQLELQKLPPQWANSVK